jgi:hypothetical protein
MMGVWDVEGTDEFADWFGTLTSEQQEALDDRVKLLAISKNLSEKG